MTIRFLSRPLLRRPSIHSQSSWLDAHRIRVSALAVVCAASSHGLAVQPNGLAAITTTRTAIRVRQLRPGLVASPVAADRSQSDGLAPRATPVAPPDLAIAPASIGSDRRVQAQSGHTGCGGQD